MFFTLASLCRITYLGWIYLSVEEGGGRVGWRQEGGGVFNNRSQTERKRARARRYLCRWNGFVGGRTCECRLLGAVSGKLVASGKQKSCFSETIGAEAGWKAVTLSWLLFSPHSCECSEGWRSSSFSFVLFLFTSGGYCLLQPCTCVRAGIIIRSRLLIFMSNRNAFAAVALWEAE